MGKLTEWHANFPKQPQPQQYNTMKQGWIKLHRGFTDWEWYQDANATRLFLHLLLTANHKQAKWKGNTVGRGQLITSRDHLAQELGMTIQVVRTSLLKLKKAENVTIESTNRFTLITVCNYDTYQSEEDAINQPDNQRVTSKEPTDNKRITTNKNDKNKENEENEKKTTSVSVKDAHQLRAEKLFNRKEYRQLDKSEISAWNSAKDIVKSATEREWKEIEAFYAAPQRETYARKSFATLLNNFSGELDRAAEWYRKNNQPQTKLGTPTQWT